MKKIISLLVLFAISCQLLVTSAFADFSNEPLPDMVQHIIETNDMGTIVEQRKLYDFNDNEVGFCLDFENAYLIYLLNGTVTEFSCEDNSEYFGSDDISYYGGPMAYYKYEDNNYVDMLSEKTVSEDDFKMQTNRLSEIEEPQANRLQVKENQVIKSSILEDDKVVYLKHDLRTEINYNTKGTCAAIATEIMLFYYYDFISKDYIKNSFFVNYPEAFHDYLVATYFKKRSDDMYGQNVSDILFGTDSYFIGNEINNHTYFKSYSETLIYTEMYESISDFARPLILVLHENPDAISEWAINHAVVVHGFSDPAIYGQYHYAFYYVNDGWGHNNKAIFDSSAYITGVIRYYK